MAAGGQVRRAGGALGGRKATEQARDFAIGLMGAVLASVALGVLIGLTSHGGSALLAFVLGMLFFPAYVWATVTAFQRKRDWVGFGMIAAVLLAWPAFTIACFAAVGPSFN